MPDSSTPPPPRPVSLWVAAIGSICVGGLLLLGALIGAVSALNADPAFLEETGDSLLESLIGFLIVAGVGAGLAFGALALLLHHAWGWWCCLVAHVGVVLLLTICLALMWDFFTDEDLLISVILIGSLAVPLLFSAAMILMLVQARVRSTRPVPSSTNHDPLAPAR